MCTKVLAKLIQDDITSRTAASVRTNPKNAGKFATDADVPPFLCMCSGELLLGSGFDPVEFVNSVIYKYGSDLTDRDNGIELWAESQESAFSPDNLHGDHDDQIGAELQLVKILCRVGRIADDSKEDMVRQLDLRIRYLLDSRVRGEFKPPGFSTAMPAILDPTGIDSSIDPELGIEVEWLKQQDNDNKKERISIYRCQFIRVFAY
jgi:hypothetical protein